MTQSKRLQQHWCQRRSIICQQDERRSNSPTTAAHALATSTSMSLRPNSSMHNCAADAWFHVRTATPAAMAASRARETTQQQQRQHDLMREMMVASSANEEVEGGDAEEWNMIMRRALV